MADPMLGDYVVAFRSRASARFMPEQQLEVRAASYNDDGEGPDLQLVYTKWADVGSSHPVADDLMIEVRGRARSLERALKLFAGFAQVTATVVAFTANVRCERPEFLVGWLANDEPDGRPFAHAFLRSDAAGATSGRRVQARLAAAVFDALFVLPDRTQRRLLRAMWQYDLAIREWAVGSEWRTVSHLWMAAEALTPLIRQRELDRNGWTQADLARRAGQMFGETDPSKWSWRIDPYCRREVIFSGDKATYDAAKDASDGLEHGFKDIAEVQSLAAQVAIATLGYVRSAIANLLNLESAVFDEITAIAPLDVLSERHIAHGVLLGSGDPAPEGERYARLEWRSRISSVVRHGDAVTVEQNRHVVVRIRDDMQLRIDADETVGRPGEGDPPGGVVKPIEVTYGSVRAFDLLDSALRVVIMAAESAGSEPWPALSDIAFNYFGQGVASFQSARTLCRADQPLEALLPLRNLVFVAALFENIDGDDRQGVGFAVRAAIDSIERDFTQYESADERLRSSAERARARVADWQAIAVEQHIDVPAAVPSPKISAIWQSLEFEMGLADKIAEFSYTPILMHVDRSGGPGAEVFRSALEPGPLADVIASAAAVALLTLFRSAAPMFNWTVPDHLEQLIATAREMNDTQAANWSGGAETGSSN